VDLTSTMQMPAPTALSSSPTAAGTDDIAEASTRFACDPRRVEHLRSERPSETAEPSERNRTPAVWEGAAEAPQGVRPSTASPWRCSRTKVARRSIHLTPFGVDFCRTCLVDPEEAADLPEQGIPQD